MELARRPAEEVAMKAVVHKGPFTIAVEDRPEPTIEGPLDAVVRITTTNICGSDLHEGWTSVEEGKVLGHEDVDIIEALGAGVERIRAGDRVSVPFNISCGTCRNCTAGWTSFCLRTYPIEGMDGAAYGYANMGRYDGGQAELLRVPFADFNLLELPPGRDFEPELTLLSDVFPTGYHGCEPAGVGPGDSVAVFGAGSVGLMAAHSAYLRGASRVFVVDEERDRLALAEKITVGPLPLLLWNVLHQGPVDGDRPVPGRALQPPAARPHRRRARNPRLPRLPRTAARCCAGGLREVRPAARGLHQGAPAPGGLSPEGLSGGAGGAATAGAGGGPPGGRSPGGWPVPGGAW